MKKKIISVLLFVIMAICISIIVVFMIDTMSRINRMPDYDNYVDEFSDPKIKSDLALQEMFENPEYKDGSVDVRREMATRTLEKLQEDGFLYDFELDPSGTTYCYTYSDGFSDSLNFGND